MDCWVRQRTHRRGLGGKFRRTSDARHVRRARGDAALGGYHARIAPAGSPARSTSRKREAVAARDLQNYWSAAVTVQRVNNERVVSRGNGAARRLEIGRATCRERV